MRHFVPLDPETQVSTECWAVVYVPKRTRGRFPANCVQTVDSQAQALREAKPAERRFAARVIGPSKSSEGQYIYYLVGWLAGSPA